MANYDEWNSAILSYFVEGTQRGSSIFLSIDDDVITQVGREIGMIGEQFLRDFRLAIQQRLFEGNRIKLHRVQGRNTDGEPLGIAFLSAMVLAASLMAAEEDGISQSNYFTRLREVLALPNDSGRPYGMESGEEKPLWQEWNLWLQEHGLLPSAYPGTEGPMKYITYPISQALLRRTDKDRLRKLFTDKRWYQDWDVETLLVQVRREAYGLSQHLRELLDSEGLRYQAVGETIHDFYEAWLSDREIGQADDGTIHTAHLLSGLYRTEDSIRDHVEYFLYPRSPRRHHIQRIQVEFAGALHTLTDERPGWYYPIGSVNGVELDQGARYAIEQPTDIEVLVLLQRQFWILIPDPYNQDSGVYASWGAPSLGIPFIILCRKELVHQLEHLRGERLIEWSGKAHPLTISDHWFEIHYCMIILKDWSGVHIENQQLYEALRPRQALNISASGGLHAPKLGGWIEGYGPQITVFGFDPQANVRVIRIVNNMLVMEKSQSTNKPFEVAWTETGDYRVEAWCKWGEPVRRLVKIVSWEQLRLNPPEHKESINLGSWNVSGAYIE